MSQLEIIAETRVPVGVRPALRRAMGRLMRLRHIEAGICIVLSNDEKLRALKLQFWGEDVTTDVLSFPQWEPGDPFVPEMLGDIVISVETAARQALEHGHDLTTEIVILSSHGLTHLLGFDHATEREWEPFRAMERAALEALRV
jgi:probable rRNA maturation factor